MVLLLPNSLTRDGVAAASRRGQQQDDRGRRPVFASRSAAAAGAPPPLPSIDFAHIKCVTLSQAGIDYARKFLDSPSEPLQIQEL